MIKALILDLDNTIFNTQNIAEEVFKDVFPLMDKYRGKLGDEELEQAKAEMSRTPVQKLAGQYGFPAEFTEQAIAILKTVKYDRPTHPIKITRSSRRSGCRNSWSPSASKNYRKARSIA